MLTINVMTPHLRGTLRVRRYRERHLEAVRTRKREYARKLYTMNPDKYREIRRKRYAADPDRVQQLCRKWRESNPEKVQELSRRRYAANPDESRARVNKWRKANPDKVQEKHAQWCEANADKCRAYSNNRRARKLGTGESYSTEEWQTLKRQYRFRCVCCWKTESALKLLGRKLVPDHIVPLSKGGLNSIENIQPLCHGTGGCNNKKHVQTIDYVIS